MHLETATWIPLKNVCSLLNVKEKTIKDRCYKGLLVYKVVRKDNRNQYFIHFDSLPLKAKKSYVGENKIDLQNYSEAPAWAKLQAEKYILILKSARNLRGEKLRDFVISWNEKNSDRKTSYTSIIRMRQRYAESGINGLLVKYGTNANKTSVPDKYYNYFKNLYLKEGAPSVKSCWDITLGYAIRTDLIFRENFPSEKAFSRRLQREIPKQSIYLARYGQSAWNRKYQYIQYL